MSPDDLSQAKSFIPPAFSSTKTTLDRHRVAVLPLNNISPDPADEYFASGLTDELISTISRIRGLRVISRTSSERARETRKGIQEIGRDLGAGTILEGSVRKAANTIRVTAQLVDAKTEEHLWSQTYDRPLEDVFAVQSDIALNVAKELESRLTDSERAIVEKPPTTSSEAHELYLRGNYYKTKETREGLEKAIECFIQALEKDPKFALVYSDLGLCYLFMGYRGYVPEQQWYPKAREYITKALELDDSLASAHVTLARMLGLHWEFKRGEEEVKRAMELNPSLAYAHRIYATYLVVLHGRGDEAEEAMRRAEELDPLSVGVINESGFNLTFLRKYDQAIEKYKRCLELSPMNPLNLSNLGCVYLEKSMFSEALSAFQKAVEVSGGDDLYNAYLCYGYARAGKVDDAMKLLNTLEERLEETHLDSYLVAQVYTALGDNDEALEWLERAYQQHSPNLAFLRVDPPLDPLRSDPRFKALVQRVGLDR